MAGIHSRSMTVKDYEKADDLKQIRGIGPGIESRLQAAGIRTYSQLAALTPEEVVAQVGKLIGMSAERVIQQEWIGQARMLASESGEAEREMEVQNSHQHYASFSVELLLDKDNNVRRTKVQHVQSLVSDTWAGWEAARLYKFMDENANMKLSAQLPGLVSQPSQKPVEKSSIPSILQNPPPETPELAGEMRLTDMTVGTTYAEGDQRFVYGDQPFNVSLSLDLADLNAPRDIPLSYSATVYAKKVDGGKHRVVGSSEGTLFPVEHVSLDVKDIQLTPGAYWIEAFVQLKPPRESAVPVSGLMAMTEGTLLHII